MKGDYAYEGELVAVKELPITLVDYYGDREKRMFKILVRPTELKGDELKIEAIKETRDLIYLIRENQGHFLKAEHTSYDAKEYASLYAVSGTALVMAGSHPGAMSSPKLNILDTLFNTKRGAAKKLYSALCDA
jgi:hypothetical protein